MPINIRLDQVFNLPPFWLSFAFMALVSLPMSYVAFPIAAAPLGVLPSLGIIALVALVMCTSTSAIAEAIVLLPPESRPKNLHDLVEVYLGKWAGTATSLAIAIIFFVVLVACNISIVETLCAFTGLPKILWLVILGVVTLLVISFGSIAHSLSLVAGAIAMVVMLESAMKAKRSRLFPALRGMKLKSAASLADSCLGFRLAIKRYKRSPNARVGAARTRNEERQPHAAAVADTIRGAMK